MSYTFHKGDSGLQLNSKKNQKVEALRNTVNLLMSNIAFLPRETLR